MKTLAISLCMIIASHIGIASASTSAEKRVALVIGNSDYKSAPLRNPRNDATDVATLLEQELGFSTTLLLDGDQAAMQRAIRSFSQEMKDADVRVFYFAGHGVSVDGSNYMIPVGTSIQNEEEVQWEAVESSLVLSQMEKSKTGVNLLILDACRDNPFPKSTRSSQRGLDIMSAPVGSLILYATAPGQVALDGTGRNGTFTKHLLRSMTAPNVHIGDIALDVRVAVMQETNNKQVPWSESSLTRRVYLAGQSEINATATLNTDNDRAESVSQNEQNMVGLENEPENNYEASILQAYFDTALAGDAIAQASLGYIYDVGRSIPEDNIKAKYWYEKASTQQYWDAAVNLGVMYQSGDGVSVDKKHAYELFEKSAIAGNSSAQRNLGAMYQFGDYVDVDMKLAHTWFERAAAQGNTDAFVDLGDLYSRGLGVRKNNQIALKWYIKAAKQGSADAQTEVGYFFDQGIGVPRDYQQALEWFQRAASQKHPVGLYNLGEMFELGKGVETDLVRAKTLYGMAAQLGNSSAVDALSRMNK